jgi:hypothetical protein
MKSVFSKIFQVVAIAGQAFNMYSGFIPAKYQDKIAIGIGMAQGGIGVVAHYYNPDGTKITPVPSPPVIR